MEAPTTRIPEFAHYYGYPVWNEEFADWVKSLLLFFDGIALTLPETEMEQLIEFDPVLAQPLCRARSSTKLSARSSECETFAVRPMERGI